MANPAVHKFPQDLSVADLHAPAQEPTGLVSMMSKLRSEFGGATETPSVAKRMAMTSAGTGPQIAFLSRAVVLQPIAVAFLLPFSIPPFPANPFDGHTPPP